jgi:hypothetical protein
LVDKLYSLRRESHFIKNEHSSDLFDLSASNGLKKATQGKEYKHDPV